MRIDIVCKYYDMWVGAFWDSKKKWLYILPIPCIGIVIKFKPNKEDIHGTE